MISDLLKVEDRVKALLEHYPQVRDSDKLLWLAYSVNYSNLRDVLGDKYPQFRAWLLDKNTPQLESIRRSRQKIQASNPHLAGDRQAKLAEATVVKEQYALRL